MATLDGIINAISQVRPRDLATTTFIVAIVDPSDEIHIYQRKTAILTPSQALEETLKDHGLMFDNPFLPRPPDPFDDEAVRMEKLTALAFSQNFLVKVTEAL